MPLIFYNNNKAKNDDLNILTDIFISKNKGCDSDGDFCGDVSVEFPSQV